jgi:hypothetical protein
MELLWIIRILETFYKTLLIKNTIIAWTFTACILIQAVNWASFLEFITPQQTLSNDSLLKPTLFTQVSYKNVISSPEVSIHDHFFRVGIQNKPTPFGNFSYISTQYDQFIYHEQDDYWVGIQERSWTQEIRLKKNLDPVRVEIGLNESTAPGNDINRWLPHWRLGMSSSNIFNQIDVECYIEKTQTPTLPILSIRTRNDFLDFRPVLENTTQTVGGIVSWNSLTFSLSHSGLNTETKLQNGLDVANWEINGNRWEWEISTLFLEQPFKGFGISTFSKNKLSLARTNGQLGNLNTDFFEYRTGASWGILCAEYQSVSLLNTRLVSYQNPPSTLTNIFAVNVYNPEMTSWKTGIQWGNPKTLQFQVHFSNFDFNGNLTTSFSPFFPIALLDDQALPFSKIQLLSLCIKKRVEWGNLFLDCVVNQSIPIRYDSIPKSKTDDASYSDNSDTSNSTQPSRERVASFHRSPQNTFGGLSISTVLGITF